MTFIVLIPTLYVLYKVAVFVWNLTRYYGPVKAALSKRKDLKLAGDWAIITGGTDGIGKAFAEELAHDGLNIFLVSRNAEKLTKVAEELEGKFHIETKTFAADFTKVKSKYFNDAPPLLV